MHDKGTRVRVLESSGDKCAGGLGVVVDISDSALFPYTVKVDGEMGFRNYRMDEIEKVEKRDPLVGKSVKVLDSESTYFIGKTGKVVEVRDDWEIPYRVHFPGEGHVWFKAHQLEDEAASRNPEVGESLEEKDASPRMDDWVTVTREGSPYKGLCGVICDGEKPYLVRFTDGWMKSYGHFDAADLEVLKFKDLVEARKTPEAFAVGDFVEVDSRATTFFGLRGVVRRVRPFASEKYRVQFFEVGSGAEDSWFSRDELVLLVKPESVPVEDRPALQVRVEEPGAALIGKTVQIKPGVMFAGEFGTVAGVHDSVNNTYHVDFGTGERIKHYYPLEYLEILPSVGDRVKINEGNLRTGDIGRVAEVKLDSGSPWRVVFDSTESANYRYFVEDLEVVPEDTETLYVPGGGLVDWSGSVSVPIVVPEAPVVALEDESVRIRLEDGQVVVEALGTPFDEVRIASGLLHGLIRQWHEREEGANRRTAMDMLDLNGEFGELPEEDQAAVDSVVAMMKRRDWI